MCRGSMKVGNGSLTESFASAIYQVRAVRLPPECWQGLEIPAHLRVRFLIFDDKGKVLAASRDLSQLLQRYQSEAAKPLPSSAVEERWNRSNIIGWDFGTLPEQVDVGRSGWPLINYPALVDDGERLHAALRNSNRSGSRPSKRSLSTLCAGNGQIIQGLLKCALALQKHHPLFDANGNDSQTTGG